jgi:hypothetical protein
MNRTIRVDTERLAEIIARDQTRRRSAPFRWRLRVFVRTLIGAGILIMGVLPAMDHSSAAALDPAGSRFWVLVAATLLAAVVSTAIDELVQRRLGDDPVETAARFVASASPISMPIPTARRHRCRKPGASPECPWR